MNRQVAAAMICGGALLCWGAAQLQTARLLHQWQRIDQNERITALTANEAPPAALRPLLEASLFWRDSAFPANYDKSLAALQEALELAPLDSGLWLETARVHVYRGSHISATAALRESDRLAPMNIPKRIASMQLWLLLGEEDQAFSLARRAGDAGLDQAASAMKELLRAGTEPVQAYRAVVGGEIDPSDLRTLLARARVSDPQTVLRIQDFAARKRSNEEQ